MISTFYSTDALDTSRALVAAGGVGLLLGFILETSGLGSSRRITGVFYLKNMTLVKVMLTAILTCAFGLHYLIELGWLGTDAVYYLPTVYGAYVVGGLIFGAGFVMGGWCPGTAVTGLGSGKIDALVFLIGAILGSSVYDDLFKFIKPLYNYGDKGTVFIYNTLGVSRLIFLIILSVAAIVCFWLCGYVEKRNSKDKND